MLSYNKRIVNGRVQFLTFGNCGFVFYSLISPEKDKSFCTGICDSIYCGQEQNHPSVALKSGCGQQQPEELVLYIPEIEEIRISSIVARKGFLNVLEQKTNGWNKRWVVSIS